MELRLKSMTSYGHTQNRVDRHDVWKLGKITRLIMVPTNKIMAIVEAD